jgi:hypothetical protein
MTGTRRRLWTSALTLVVGALGVLFLLPASPAAAVDVIPGLDDLDCKAAPAPVRPDSGIAGWFLSEPRNAPKGDPFAKNATVSIYDVYGYGGFDYETYDLGCGGAARDPAAGWMSNMADIVTAPALFLVGLDNSVREYAYRPDSMWGWTNDFVKRASDALRDRVFTVWGAVVLGLVGLWLLWGARGGNLSQAAVTAGWAILVMALVTAVASWPVQASTVADKTLTGALGQISAGLSGGAPDDKREPAVRASGVLVDTVLYDQWLRGTLGSAENETARKYGPDLYRARAISWAEVKEMRKGAKQRERIIDAKKKLWTDTAEKVKKDDPDAYEYLVGRKGSERVGSAMLATISALVVTPFDLMASLLILIAFLIIRLAVAFLPAIGTIGILRPASGPLRGLLRTVLAAFINCVIFGAGSAVFLLAVSVITGTNSLAGWQQILLIWLTGLVLWLLLRPYRRLTQLTGMDPFGEMAGGLGRMHKRVFGDMKQLAIAGAGAYLGDVNALEADEKRRNREAARPETWSQRVAARMSKSDDYRETQDANAQRAARQQGKGEVYSSEENRELVARAAEHNRDKPGDRRPETGGRRKPSDGAVVIPATRAAGGERQPASSAAQQTPRRVAVEESGIVPDGERRLIYRPGSGITHTTGDSRVSQAAANAASAAHAAREAVAAAAALTRDSRQRRPDG